jgi:hypothetical protein
MTKAFSSPEELDEYVRETSRLLERAGHAEAASELNKITSTAWTTASEWLGELGFAIRRIHALGDVPEAIVPRLRRISKAARGARR